MDNRDIGLYLREAETQCRLVIGAVIALNNAMAIPSDAQDSPGCDRMPYIHGEIFRSIHSLLTHASNISRLFWPPVSHGRTVARRNERGRILRQRVSLPEHGHPLHKRTLRDHLEHFDERLDHWRETSVRRNYVQDVVGPKGMIQGIEEADMMRWYDPSRRIFIFRGEEYDIQELVSAVEALRPLLLPAAEAAEDEGRKVRG